MDLFSHINEYTVILTPNLRLAVVLQKQYQQKQIESGKKSWLTLPILEINRWIQKLWFDFVASELRDFPLLLSPMQEQLIWENILKNSAENHYLLQTSKTAELARAAWNTLKQWQVSLENPALLTTEDGIAFNKWAQEFKTHCEKNNWIDTTSIIEMLFSEIGKKTIPIPDKIILTGFAELSPQQKDFLKTCEQVKAEVIFFNPSKRNQTTKRISLTDTDTELRSMAKWAKALYQNNINDTICCVIPNLEDVREKVIRVFSSIFTDEKTYHLDYTKLPFNISAGRSLAAYPVIHAALEILKIENKQLSIETLSYILRSPFLVAAETDMASRSILVQKLRNDNVVAISLQELADQYAAYLSKKILECIQKFVAVLPTLTAQFSLSKWVEIFLQILTTLGWPGERSLDSAEFQTTKAWLNLLSEYASFENTLEAVYYHQALQYLIYLTGNCVFQPESPEARIQILGPLEAAALPFDHMWVMGLNDTAWPQSPKPNPFIPQKLQKQLLMPRASADRELVYAQYITEQFKTNTKNVIFSFNNKEEDAELSPSPLIADIPLTSTNELNLPEIKLIEHWQFAAKKLETLKDDIAPPISHHEKIRGGSNIFKNQALCPFKAFAELRLHANKTELPMLGLRPKDRGDIVHLAMERIWSELKDQASLNQLSQDNLDALIEKHLQQAIKKVVNPAKASRFLELESQRLKKLFLDWFELEKQRPPFKIKALERDCQATIGGLSITVRADRIDMLENGKQIIIDYKTGKTNPARDWFDDRPNEPQLPLYAILNSEQTLGILFAQLNTEELKWKGVSELSLEVDSVKKISDEKNTQAPSWQEQNQKWQKILEKLATDFSQGIAHIDPKNEIETCRYCHLHTLCRVQETNHES